MNKIYFRWVTGFMILLFIVSYAFSFVLYEGDAAVITRFGAARKVIDDAGLHFKLPWPFETVHTFDKRLRYHDTSFIETLTRDKRNIITQTYVIWSVKDPLKFMESTGSSEAAQNYLDSLIINAKNGIMGRYDLSAVVSMNKDEIKLTNIEQEVLFEIQDRAYERFGIEVNQVGLKKLGFPESNIKHVLEQMRQERLQYVAQLVAEGERDANIIRNETDVEAARLRAEGMEEAARIIGESEREVARVYAEAHSKNPELYSLLRRLTTLENTLGENSTLIIDLDQPPFDVLKGLDRGE